MESHELKGLETKLKQIDLAILGAKGEVREANFKMVDLQRERRKLEENLALLKIGFRQAPVVTEHAILRYLQRVKGVDLEEIRQEILSPSFLELWVKIGGNGKFPIQDGIRCVVKNGMITTIED